MNQVIKPKLMFNQKKEKRNKKIMFIICALFFLIAYASQAQFKNLYRDKEIVDGKECVRKAPPYPMKFTLLNGKDTLFLSATADSVGDNVYIISLYSYGTENMKLADKGIKIWYKDLSLDEFEVAEFNQKEQWIKYNIIGHSLSNLFHKEMLAIELNPIMYCEWIDKKRYFMDFFAVYDK